MLEDQRSKSHQPELYITPIFNMIGEHIKYVGKLSRHAYFANSLLMSSDLKSICVTDLWGYELERKRTLSSCNV